MGEIPEAVLDTLRADGVVAYPTSTLPGLATLPNATALDALYALKQRSANQPVSLGVASLQQAKALVDVPDFAQRLLDGFERGALTLILDAHIPLDPRLGGTRVAVRVFAHPSAIALAEAIGPVTATSANIAGEPLESKSSQEQAQSSQEQAQSSQEVATKSDQERAQRSEKSAQSWQMAEGMHEREYSLNPWSPNRGRKNDLKS